jgi:hypothetical protein
MARLSTEVFARRLGISLATLYRLPPQLKPRSVKLVGRRFVLETPAEYLARVEQMQLASEPQPKGTLRW